MNILVQQNPLNKFTSNIGLLQNDHTIYSLDINGRLYGLQDKLNINCSIFHMSMLTQEIIQYIIEFSSSVKMIVYQDVLNIDFINTYHKHCINLVEENIVDKCTTLPNLLNEQIFIPNIPKNFNHEIVTFLNQCKELPESLTPFLYPASKSSKIKIFNSPFVKHVQNLGMLQEKEKNTLLNESKYFLAYDSQYITEALYLGCKVLTPDELSTQKPNTYTKIQEYTTYNNYLKVLLNEQY